MSVDLEAGGAFATAGLAAHEIDSRTEAATGKAEQSQSASKKCANCNAQLHGRFCSVCGQSSHVHRSLWHMFEEALHGVLHFDTKSWRTIPLLFARPGLLTRRYIEGQRVRYVSPLALFLFCTFLMFFGLSMFDTSKGLVDVNTDGSREEARAELAGDVETAKQEVVKASAALAAAKTNEDRDEIAKDLRGAVTELQVAETVLKTFDKTAAVAAAIDKTGSATQGAAEADKPDQSAKTEINTGNAKLDSIIKQATENQELLKYKLKNTAYKFSFMLIPISLPFLWLMFFWRRGVTMYDHAVFSLYSLSFMSLFALLFVSVNSLSTPKSIMVLLGCVPMIHMFMQLRETYSLGFGSTLWRTIGLLFIAGTVFLLFLLLVIAITFA